MKREAESISFCGVLFIVFFVLKILGYLNWSWWWITAPLWMPIAIAASILIVVFSAGYVLTRDEK